jgi:hypothetical protein
MKNILGKNENLILFNEQGKIVYKYNTYLSGYWSERTYDDNGNVLTCKDSDGVWYERTYDEKGNELTYKDSEGYWYEYTRDDKGKELTYKNSNGYWCEYTRDEKGNELTFKDSDGEKRGFDIPEYTMEELVEKLGNFKIKK